MPFRPQPVDESHRCNYYMWWQTVCVIPGCAQALSTLCRAASEPAISAARGGQHQHLAGLQNMTGRQSVQLTDLAPTVRGSLVGRWPRDVPQASPTATVWRDAPGLGGTGHRQRRGRHGTGGHRRFSSPERTRCPGRPQRSTRRSATGRHPRRPSAVASADTSGNACRSPHGGPIPATDDQRRATRGSTDGSHVHSCSSNTRSS